MKKFLSLVLCLLMLTIVGTAFAESVEDIYDGTWISFQDGPEFYVPADWQDIEMTEELLESGLIYAIASPDGAYTFQLYWSALEEDMEIDALLTQMQEAYPGSELIDLESVALVCYSDAEADVLGFAALDAVEPGLYQFIFTPASDETLQLVASTIITSLAEE